MPAKFPITADLDGAGYGRFAPAQLGDAGAQEHILVQGGRRQVAHGERPGDIADGRQRAVRPPFRVFVNGVEQHEGEDYAVEDGDLVFSRSLAQEAAMESVQDAGLDIDEMRKIVSRS